MDTVLRHVWYQSEGSEKHHAKLRAYCHETVVRIEIKNADFEPDGGCFLTWEELAGLGDLIDTLLEDRAVNGPMMRRLDAPPRGKMNDLALAIEASRGVKTDEG